MNAPTTLTDRYLSAAGATVPPAVRADVRAELAAAIADAIEARRAAGDDPRQAERTALSSLGDPERLAADYAGRPLHLIGPRYFLSWRRLTSTLLAIVSPIVGAAVALASVLGSESLLLALESGLWAAVMTAGAVAFWTTVGFAVAERINPAPVGRAWSVDDLPEIRSSSMGVGEFVASLTMLAVLAVVVVWDQVRGFAVSDGQPLPFLSPDLWPWAILGLLAVLVAEALLAVAVFRRGRWTVGLAVVNAVLNLIVTIPAVYLAANGALVNPAFVASAGDVVSVDLAGMLNTVVAAAFVLVAAIDITDAFVKAARARRG